MKLWNLGTLKHLIIPVATVRMMSCNAPASTLPPAPTTNVDPPPQVASVVTQDASKPLPPLFTEPHHIKTIAKGFTAAEDVAAGPSGEVYVLTSFGREIHKVSPEGAVTRFASFAAELTSLAVDAAGVVYATGRASRQIFRINADGVVSTVLSDLELEPLAIAVDPAGKPVVVSDDGSVFRLNGGAIEAVVPGNFLNGTAAKRPFGVDLSNGTADKIVPTKIAIDSASTLWCASGPHNTVFTITMRPEDFSQTTQTWTGPRFSYVIGPQPDDRRKWFQEGPFQPGSKGGNLENPSAIAISARGETLVADGRGFISSFYNGEARIVAGKNYDYVNGTDPDGVDVQQAEIRDITGMCIGPDNVLYVLERDRLRRIAPHRPEPIPAHAVSVVIRTEHADAAAYAPPADGATPVSPTTVKLQATVTMSDGTQLTEVTWQSGDETVATVSADGTVTAVKTGECEITATSLDGKAVGKYQITVKEGLGKINVKVN